MSIIVMADGGANITKSMIKKYEIDILPYNIVFANGDVYKDIVDIKNQKKLLDLMYQHDDLPKIGHLNMDNMESVFRKHIENGDDILYITSSSKFSNSYKKAVSVSKKFDPSMIEIVDSLNVGSGETLLALYAREYIKLGHGLRQTAKYLNEIKHDIKSCYAVGNSNYLYNKKYCKGKNNNYFDIQNSFPIVEVNKGQLILTYSTKEGELALQILKNAITDNCNSIDKTPVIIAYSGDKSICSKLKEYISKSFSKNIIVLEHNTLVFLNTGLNTLSITFLGKSN